MENVRRRGLRVLRCSFHHSSFLAIKVATLLTFRARFSANLTGEMMNLAGYSFPTIRIPILKLNKMLKLNLNWFGIILHLSLLRIIPVYAESCIHPDYQSFFPDQNRSSSIGWLVELGLNFNAHTHFHDGNTGLVAKKITLKARKK